MKMHLLPCGRLRMRKNIFLPEAARSETIELPVSSALLRHSQANVLFDTGCHPAVAEDPEGRWGGLAKLMTPIMQPGEHVLTGLAGIGLEPDDIDLVINSHLHPDHCGCNAFFRKATFLVHRDELAAARAPGSEVERLSRLPIGSSRCRSMRSAISATCLPTAASSYCRCPATRQAPWAYWRGSIAAAPICLLAIP